MDYKLKSLINGWLRARWGWVVCAASFVIHAGVIALAYTYGLFFVDIQQELNATTLETGWIGSVMYGVQMFSSPIGSFLESCLSHRSSIILVVLVSSFAIFASSFAQSVLQLFVTIGVIYGLTVGIAWFIMLSVITQYFPTKNSVRAVSFVAMGSAFIVLVLSEPVSIGIEAMGWRSTLQFMAAFTLAIALPPAFLISPPNVSGGVETAHSSPDEGLDSLKASDGRTAGGEEEESEEDTVQRLPQKREEILAQGTKKVEYETHLQGATRPRRRMERWKTALSADALLYSVFIITSAMSWSVFYVNIVSFYDSVGLDNYQSASLLTVACVAELLSKLFIATVGEKFTYKKTYLLLMEVILLTGLSVMMLLGTSFWYFVTMSAVTGSLRACQNVLLYPCAIETFGTDCSDEAIIIVSISKGIGFLTGTIPAGAIYDATGSYFLSFILVAAISSCSVGALSTVLLCSRTSGKLTAEVKTVHHQLRPKEYSEGGYRNGRLETSV